MLRNECPGMESGSGFDSLSTAEGLLSKRWWMVDGSADTCQSVRRFFSYFSLCVALHQGTTGPYELNPSLSDGLSQNRMDQC